MINIQSHLPMCSWLIHMVCDPSKEETATEPAGKTSVAVRLPDRTEPPVFLGGRASIPTLWSQAARNSGVPRAKKMCFLVRCFSGHQVWLSCSATVGLRCRKDLAHQPFLVKVIGSAVEGVPDTTPFTSHPRQPLEANQQRHKNLSANLFITKLH